MDWPAYNPVVTVVDVLEVGACIDGVKSFVLEHGGLIAGAVQDFHGEEWILKAAHANGYGYGYGYGYGDGYGYGYGADED